MKNKNSKKDTKKFFKKNDYKSSFSLKFWKERMIRSDMEKIEKLIILLESREFLIEYSVAQKWFYDTVDLLKKKCRIYLVDCAEELANSKNYNEK